jgi:hypothetical protein
VAGLSTRDCFGKWKREHGKWEEQSQQQDS